MVYNEEAEHTSSSSVAIKFRRFFFVWYDI